MASPYALQLEQLDLSLNPLSNQAGRTLGRLLTATATTITALHIAGTHINDDTIDAMLAEVVAAASQRSTQPFASRPDRVPPVSVLLLGTWVTSKGVLRLAQTALPFVKRRAPRRWPPATAISSMEELLPPSWGIEEEEEGGGLGWMFAPWCHGKELLDLPAEYVIATLDAGHSTTNTTDAAPDFLVREAFDDPPFDMEGYAERRRGELLDDAGRASFDAAWLFRRHVQALALRDFALAEQELERALAYSPNGHIMAFMAAHPTLYRDFFHAELKRFLFSSEGTTGQLFPAAAASVIGYGASSVVLQSPIDPGVAVKLMRVSDDFFCELFLCNDKFATIPGIIHYRSMFVLDHTVPLALNAEAKQELDRFFGAGAGSSSSSSLTLTAVQVGQSSAHGSSSRPSHSTASTAVAPRLGQTEVSGVRRSQPSRSSIAITEPPHHAAYVRKQPAPVLVLVMRKALCNAATLLVEHPEVAGADVANMVLQVIGVVSQMHALGTCHCDIKPQNVLIHRRDDASPLARARDYLNEEGSPFSFFAEVTDLAFSRAVSETTDGYTRLYLPPDQRRHRRPEASTARDVYALVLFCIEMLATVVIHRVVGEGSRGPEEVMRRLTPLAFDPRVIELLGPGLEPSTGTDAAQLLRQLDSLLNDVRPLIPHDGGRRVIGDALWASYDHFLSTECQMRLPCNLTRQPWYAAYAGHLQQVQQALVPTSRSSIRTQHQTATAQEPQVAVE